MRRRWREERNGWTARVAALLLVLQATLLAFSAGAAAGPVVRDQFGNVVCSADATGRHRGSPSPHDPRHAGGFDCCTLGCSMFGGFPPAPAAALPGLGRPFAPPVRFAVRENLAAAGVPASPRSAQGPPLLA